MQNQNKRPRKLINEKHPPAVSSFHSSFLLRIHKVPNLVSSLARFSFSFLSPNKSEHQHHGAQGQCSSFASRRGSRACGVGIDSLPPRRRRRRRRRRLDDDVIVGPSHGTSALSLEFSASSDGKKGLMGSPRCGWSEGSDGRRRRKKDKTDPIDPSNLLLSSQSGLDPPPTTPRRRSLFSLSFPSHSKSKT